MNCPVKISQSWKATKWNITTRKFDMIPIVSAKENYVDSMKPVKREVWFEFIRKGWLYVTDDLRKWLDENGYSDIKKEIETWTHL